MANEPKAAAEIRAKLESRVKRGEFHLQIGGIIREVARKMEGKTINKRFHTAVEARIKEVMGEGFTVYWRAEDWRQSVEVWTGHNAAAHLPRHGDRDSFTVGRPSKHVLSGKGGQDTISEAFIVAENQWCFLEAERLPKIREVLASDKPEKWAAQLAEAKRLKEAVGAEASAFGVLYCL